MSRVSLHNPRHSNSLLREANRMRLCGTLCDVVITVDSQEFPAHSLVLACASRTLETLFRRRSPRYALDFLPPRTFQQILEYSYTERVEARPEELGDLLQAAKILEMGELGKQILEATSRAGERAKGTEDGQPGGDSSTVSKTGYVNGPVSEGGPLADRNLRCPLPRQGTPSANENHHLIGRPTARFVRTSSAGIVEREASAQEMDSTIEGREAADLKEDQSGPQSPDCDGTEPRPSLGADRPQMLDSGYNLPPIRGSVITAANKSHRGRADADREPCDAADWPSGRRAPSLLPFPAARSFQAHPGVLPSPVTQPLPPLTFSPVAVSFGGYLSHVPQGPIPQGFRGRPGQSGTPGVGSGPEIAAKSAEGHQRRLTDSVKSYPCEICGKRFLDNLRLRVHLQAHTGSKSFLCNQCGARLITEEEAVSHGQLHSGGETVTFCLLCGKRFESQASLTQHMGTHGGSWNYTCSECKSFFPNHTALKRHLKSHAGDHTHRCEFCRHCFRDGNTLKSHKRAHLGEKPYQCSSCGKKFSLKHQLETHYRVHTGEKPFVCKLCRQRSRDYSAMIKHLRTHNGASPYQCTVCLEFCSSLSAMQKHIKSHKPEEIPPDWSLEKTYLYLCYV
ncbi:zinc finger and BTB domain-containing protein 16-like [Heptranchias perlo]|uniref:zinc finger and BTB domain-containing protein 16-like n=1 Tax=Heptranchias perlo TaxID=212740 RepID=UPI003559446E